MFEILLKGIQPLILILARGMKRRLQPELEEAILANRLLVISPFNREVKRVTRETAAIRNLKIIEISNLIAVGYKTQNGQIDRILKGKNYIVF